MEKAVKTFFGLESESGIASLKVQFSELGESPSDEAVFLKLRKLRNSW
ncbi:hypothetical protein N9060_01020 [Arenicella sp.]|nr:hypothetical protein [Arenicella sp.]